MKIIREYENNPSMLKIKEVYSDIHKFSFIHTTPEKVSKEISMLNICKACPKDTITPKIIKQNCDIFTTKINHDFNVSIDQSIFPNNLKQADITPTHKDKDRSVKTNYRPVSILPSVSKIFESVLYQQLDFFSLKILSKHQCGFRKNHSSQHSLILMLEKWRKSVDRREFSGALLTDLSKAF